MSDFFTLGELISASQNADLKKEEERLAREKAATAAHRAKVAAQGTFNISQLLEKMGGTGAEGANLQAPPSAPKKPEEKKHVDGRFPPPPTSR